MDPTASQLNRKHKRKVPKIIEHDNRVPMHDPRVPMHDISIPKEEHERSDRDTLPVDGDEQKD